jgi:hypothetical protein
MSFVSRAPALGLAFVGIAALVLLSSGPAGSSFGPAPTRAGPALVPAGAAASGNVRVAHPVPHPSAIPVRGSSPAAVHPLTHWWDGGYYGGPTRSPTSAKMTMTLPDAVPSSSEFYYVLLSSWDNAGSYDQIGISNDYGTWGWTWSWTSSCAGSYYYTPNQMALQRGATYTFAMTIASGNVTFTVTQGTSVLGTIIGASGGTHFVMTGFYTCNSVSYYDYTDYEEIYATVQTVPSFDFVFAHNSVSNGSVTNWTSFGSGAPSGLITAFQGNTVRQENQGFSMRFLGASDHVTLAATAKAYFTNLSLTRWFSTGNVSLSSAGLPAGMTLSFGSSGVAPPFNSTVTIKLSSVHAGTYLITLTGSPVSGSYTYLTLKVKVL